MDARGVGNVAKSFAVNILIQTQEGSDPVRKNNMIRIAVETNLDLRNRSIVQVGTIHTVKNDGNRVISYISYCEYASVQTLLSHLPKVEHVLDSDSQLVCDVFCV